MVTKSASVMAACCVGACAVVLAGCGSFGGAKQHEGPEDPKGVGSVVGVQVSPEPGAQAEVQSGAPAAAPVEAQVEAPVEAQAEAAPEVMWQAPSALRSASPPRMMMTERTGMTLRRADGEPEGPGDEAVVAGGIGIRAQEVVLRAGVPLRVMHDVVMDGVDVMGENYQILTGPGPGEGEGAIQVIDAPARVQLDMGYILVIGKQPIVLTTEVQVTSTGTTYAVGRTPTADYVLGIMVKPDHPVVVTRRNGRGTTSKVGQGQVAIIPRGAAAADAIQVVELAAVDRNDFARKLAELVKERMAAARLVPR